MEAEVQIKVIAKLSNNNITVKHWWGGESVSSGEESEILLGGIPKFPPPPLILEIFWNLDKEEGYEKIAQR